MIIEDWEDFLDYLNHISGTDDFDIEKLEKLIEAGGSGFGNKNIPPTEGAQIICDGLWKIVKSNPAFRQKADVDNIATDHGMMAQPGMVS